jgi:hypothetical protein
VLIFFWKTTSGGRDATTDSIRRPNRWPRARALRFVSAMAPDTSRARHQSCPGALAECCGQDADSSRFTCPRSGKAEDGDTAARSSLCCSMRSRNNVPVLVRDLAMLSPGILAPTCPRLRSGLSEISPCVWVRELTHPTRRDTQQATHPFALFWSVAYTLQKIGWTPRARKSSSATGARAGTFIDPGNR